MATAGAVKVKGYDAVYYLVKDLDRSTDFYNDLLQMSPTLAVPGVVSEWTFPGGETFGVYKPPEGEWERCHGLLFAVDDIQNAVPDLKSRGVQFSDEGKIDDNGECYMAFAEDPDGNRFVIHQRKQ